MFSLRNVYKVKNYTYHVGDVVYEWYVNISRGASVVHTIKRIVRLGSLSSTPQKVAGVFFNSSKNYPKIKQIFITSSRF